MNKLLKKCTSESNNEIEKKISRYKETIESLERHNESIDKIKYEYANKVIKRRNTSVLLGFAGTIILDYIFVKYMGILGLSLSKLQFVLAAAFCASPLLVGIDKALKASSKIEKDMMLNIKRLDKDHLANELSIEKNKEKIEELNKIIENTKVSCDYLNCNLENELEDEIQKTLVLKK